MSKLRLNVLIQAVGKQIWEVCNEIEKIVGVKTVHTVVGPFDAIVYAELGSPNDLRQFLDDIHGIVGIIKTETCIAA
ncbi:MAG: Lrp/AsnC ligand binding domain-containing protein [Candidatus Thorarchaeota archaeon]|nr:MAG: Lrp/AsnC ligand binding domain-containing protein [Candidatus Thorarchaeota archaeon]